jgi:hypothetical protein
MKKDSDNDLLEKIVAATLATSSTPSKKKASNKNAFGHTVGTDQALLDDIMQKGGTTAKLVEKIGKERKRLGTSVRLSKVACQQDLSIHKNRAKNNGVRITCNNGIVKIHAPKK